MISKTFRCRAVIESVLALLIIVPIAMLPGPAAEEVGKVMNESSSKPDGVKVLFLHHSTGDVIWSAGVEEWFENHNNDSDTKMRIEARTFPLGSPYPWSNYPYDYWNIWVNHAGEDAYMGEPTLEMLTRDYDLIIWKHCFPVCDVEPDTGAPDIASSVKSIENFKLQYEALKSKMHEFPQTKFIVWTGAAQVRKRPLRAMIKDMLKGKWNRDDEARRARDFFDWAKREWDEKGDNIFIWDFYELQTDGGLYFKEAHARTPTDSHPSREFSKRVAPLLCRRIIDVVEGRGDAGALTGE